MKKPHWELYVDQLRRRQSGIKFDTHSEYLNLGLKSGKFCENAIAEVVGHSFFSRGPQVRIQKKTGSYYTADGFIQDLGCYVESKNFSFYSSGTASEKLVHFLIKLEDYDKPTLLIFGGEHELLNTGPDKLIWDAFHSGSSNSSFVNAGMSIIRHKIRDIIGLSELDSWVARARQESRLSSL